MSFLLIISFLGLSESAVLQVSTFGEAFDNADFFDYVAINPTVYYDEAEEIEIKYTAAIRETEILTRRFDRDVELVSKFEDNLIDYGFCYGQRSGNHQIPGVCDGFYVCAHDFTYKIGCPEGTEYNRVLMVCDWPWDAACSYGQNEMSGSGEEIFESTTVQSKARAPKVPRIAEAGFGFEVSNLAEAQVVEPNPSEASPVSQADVLDFPLLVEEEPVKTMALENKLRCQSQAFRYNVVYLDWKINWSDIGVDIKQAVDACFNVIILAFWRAQGPLDALQSFAGLDETYYTKSSQFQKSQDHML